MRSISRYYGHNVPARSWRLNMCSGVDVPGNDAASLAEIRILDGVSAEDLADMEKACSWRRYTDHEQIIDRQSDSTDVYFVVDGRVRIVNYSLAGKEITLEDLDHGSHFGELSALDGLARRRGWHEYYAAARYHRPSDRRVSALWPRCRRAGETERRRARTHRRACRQRKEAIQGGNPGH